MKQNEQLTGRVAESILLISSSMWASKKMCVHTGDIISCLRLPASMWDGVVQRAEQ